VPHTAPVWAMQGAAEACGLGSGSFMQAIHAVHACECGLLSVIFNRLLIRLAVARWLHEGDRRHRGMLVFAQIRWWSKCFSRNKATLCLICPPRSGNQRVKKLSVKDP
jgi:hypothetical protein